MRIIVQLIYFNGLPTTTKNVHHTRMHGNMLPCVVLRCNAIAVNGVLRCQLEIYGIAAHNVAYHAISHNARMLMGMHAISYRRDLNGATIIPPVFSIIDHLLKLYLVEGGLLQWLWQVDRWS